MKKLNNRLVLATVLTMLALGVFLDGLFPLNMPNSARELVFGPAVSAVEARWKSGSQAVQPTGDRRLSWLATGAKPGLVSGLEGGIVGSATAGFGTWVELTAVTNPALYLRSVALLGEGAAAASSPLPNPPRQGNTERSKEASDGVANRDNGSAEIFPDTAIRDSNGNGNGMGQKQEVASDGMGESGHGNIGMVVSTSGRAGSSEGAGLADQVVARVAVRGVATQGIATYYHPSLAWEVSAA